MAAVTSAKQKQKLLTSSADVSGHAPASAALEAVGARPRRPQRRPTKQASYELCNHAKAYLEGGQFASGYDFLHNLLAAGTSISTPAQPYIGFIAPPAYLALASSLVVYPKTTTRTHSRDARRGADAALRYLRCIHNTLDGPAYPTIRKALSLHKEQSRRRARGHRSTTASPSPRLGEDVELIAGDAANTESLWTRAEDFWQIVGWAFNCSISYKKRWGRWKLWLDSILDFLVTDWEFCVRRSKDDEDHREEVLKESLIWGYIAFDVGSINRVVRRRIVKAVLAAASPDSLKEYPEVWDKETKGPKRSKKEEQQAREVDFETGDMADYESDDDMPDAQGDDPNDTQSEGGADTDEHDENDLLNAVEQLGGVQAIDIRQRFIALLAQVSEALPRDFTTPSDFFDNILEEFIQLPTTLFEVLLSTLKLTGRLKVAFCANLLLPLVTGKVPDFFCSELTQEHLEQSLLALKSPSQSFAANAKISLILEQMFIYGMSQEVLRSSDALRCAMEAGIESRQSVYGTGRGKRGNAEEEAEGKAILEACSERLLGMLEILEMKDGIPLQPFKVKDTASAVFPSFGSGSTLSTAPGSDTEEDD